jgi:catechol 2,3-dioxygenase-like lactoylglutathione lyase family enzyme
VFHHADQFISKERAMSHTPSIERVAHVGLFVSDLERSIAFYRDILGLQVTDQNPEAGMVFLSSHPEDEHHEVLLASGRQAPSDVRLLQQIAFRCSSLADVLAYWKRLTQHQAKIMYTITHGNAISCYFKDPDDNILEVYWQTGLKARQGFLIGLDFNKSEAQLMDEVRELVKQHGENGYIDFKLLEEQNL